MFARAIRDDRQLAIITVDFRDQQQVGDATRSCVNVHGRRQDGNQYPRRVPRDLAQLVMADAGRRIHDHVDSAVGYAQLPAAGSLHGFFIGRYAMNGGQSPRAALEPGCRRALRIEVHYGRRPALLCVESRQIGCERRLAATPFGVEYDNLVHIVVLRQYQHGLNVTQTEWI